MWVRGTDWHIYCSDLIKFKTKNLCNECETVIYLQENQTHGTKADFSDEKIDSIPLKWKQTEKGKKKKKISIIPEIKLRMQIGDKVLVIEFTQKIKFRV